MQRFCKDLYWDDAIPEKMQNKLKWRIKVSYRKMKPVYLITICEGPDQLEIFQSSTLLQKYYQKHPRMIIGIALTYESAIEIVSQISQECYSKYKHCNLKYYLSHRE